MVENNKFDVTPELLEQNPVLAMALTGMSLLIITILVGSLLSWIFLAVRARRGLPWLSAKPQPPSVWGLADLVVVVVLVVACQTLFASAYVRLSGVEISRLEGKPLPAAVSTAASFGNLAALGLTLAWLALRFQISPNRVGFRSEHWWRQLQIGVIATLAVLPIVYLMMAAVSIGLDTAYKHPLLDEIRASATLGSYLLGVLTAVLLAPLAEEFLFRVILQGWLQAIPFSSPQQIIIGANYNQRRDELQSQVILADIIASPPSNQDFYEQATSLPISPTEAEKSLEIEPPQLVSPGKPDETALKHIPPVWPAIVTGILFGLAHWGYGLSFIPLIALGIVLGLIYRSTNSIWPCLLMHMALNGTSMLGLGLSILLERAKVVAVMVEYWAR